MTKPHILLIDNYDSFAHNLARYAQIAGANVIIKRNDEISITQIKRLKPAGIIISPGPRTPREAGICIELIQHYGATIPILGICLGHQCIGEAYGGTTVQTAPKHGQASLITHDNSPLFTNITSPFEAGRYHALITDISAAPDLRITARAGELIMGITHAQHPVHGIQFHPESILTPRGQQLIDNFIKIMLSWHK